MSPQVLSVRGGAGAGPDLDRGRRQALASQARLVSVSLTGWAALAGPIAFTAGAIASSVSLLAFGIDLAVGGFSGGAVMVWRFGSKRPLEPAIRRTVSRVIALQFLLFAPIVGFESLHTFFADEHAATSALGIGISVFSLVALGGLGRAELRIGGELGSARTRAKGREGIRGACLAALVLIALLANAIAGIWWLDPAVSLLIAAVALGQGLGYWNRERSIVPQDADRCAEDRG